MQVDKEQFDKAQQFVVDTLESQPQTKEGLLTAVRLIEEEIKEAEELDYQRSLLSLVGEMNESVKEFKKDNQSQ